MRHRFNGFLGHALSAGLFLAFSSHIAGAATIVASASVSCDVEGVIENDSAPANGTREATCGTPGQTRGSGLARFDYSGNDASAYLYAEALNTVNNSVTATVSVDWSNVLILTGGTGTAFVDLAYTSFPFSEVGCAASVDGAGLSDCFNAFAIEFNVPFTLRVLLSGTARATGFPGSSTSFLGGSGSFNIQSVQVRQDGLLVAGADLVAVPEPGTWLLSCLGLGALALRRRRARGTLCL